MSRLTGQDLADIAGTTIEGYHIEGVRIKRGSFSDSDHYGIVMGKNARDHYVTWQFHLDENENPYVYWGHYMDSLESALRDFNSRDLDIADENTENEKPALTMYKVTITEKLQKSVIVEATDKAEAEQIVSDNWNDSQYILDSDDFVEVQFEAVEKGHEVN